MYNVFKTDVYHFLLDCPLYKDLEKKILLDFFIELITSENETVITNLSMFVNKSFFRPKI